VNAFLLWRWEHKSRCVGRALKDQRSQRIFREALVQSLIRPRPPVGSSGNNAGIAHIRIYQGHQLREPNESRFRARTHRIRRGSPNLECYNYRWRHHKGLIKQVKISRARTSCADYSLPLCEGCFGGYHGIAN
jgi:hypothetical protein